MDGDGAEAERELLSWSSSVINCVTGIALGLGQHSNPQELRLFTGRGSKNSDWTVRVNNSCPY